MMIAPGTEPRTMRGPTSQNASNTPRPGPGFVSSIKRIDFPVSFASATPRGPSTPWLMALLRKRTLAGSMITDAIGSRLLSTSD